MKLLGVELRRIAMPLVAPFRTSFGVEAERDILLVRALGADAEGWGECVAGTSPLYSSEYTDGAHHVLREHLVPPLLVTPEVTAGDVARILAPLKGHRMAKAALEMAVLDAELRARGVSLSEHLGGVRDRVAAGVSVGIAGSIGELCDRVAAYLEDGYVRVKLKIEPGWDVEPVAAVRERFGPDLALQVDANAAYTRADIGHLRALDQFGLVLVEQPFAEEDLRGHAELAAAVNTPLCLAESILSAEVAADAVALGACSIVNIKAGRVGGFLEARAVHDVCAAAGAPVWCGGMLETGLGRAANVALVALPGFTLPGDLSASDRYWAHDITTPFVLEDGALAVPTGPGLGVAVDDAAIEQVTTAVERLGPGAR